MSEIKEFYERYWARPEEYLDPSTPQRQAMIARYAPVAEKGIRVLEVGCGRGDISEAGVQYARDRHPGIPVHSGTVEDFAPAHAGQFDLVFSSEVIEHLFDVMSYLRAIQQVLREGGWLVLTTPYHGVVKNIAVGLFAFERHYHPESEHIRFFSARSLRDCLGRTGFALETLTGYGRPWPFWKSFFVTARKLGRA
jgi:2-polyprenyl-3-methyl-5-hydroxy-6-metoxy-1,4-benzoquinol methylase